jgi:diacylglycerol kinase family enzyme
MSTVKRRILVVLNPSSADFEADRRWPHLEPILSHVADIHVVRTDPDDVKSRAAISAALAENRDRVIAIGGDGTAHLVVNEIIKAGGKFPEFAVIPFGTANDVAKSLELPLDELDRMAEIAAGDKLGRLDVGRVRAFRDGGVEDRYFLDAVTVGMDADVLAARSNYRELGGYLAYVAALAERSLEQSSLDMRLTVDGKTIDTRVFNAVINNVPVYAGELTMPGSSRDDQLLDVYLFNRGEYASKLMSFAIKQVDILKLGVHEMLEEITENQQTFHGREIKIRLASPRKLQVDGEIFGEAAELECDVVAQHFVAVP